MPDSHPHPSDITSKGWIAAAKRIFGEISEDHLLLIAAGCAFYGLLAVFPGIVAAMAIAGLFTDPSELVGYIETLSRFMPAEAAQIVIDQAKAVAGSDEGGLGLAAVIGVLTAFWSASAGMSALIEGLNVAFEVEHPRGFFKNVLARLSLTLGLVGGFFMIVIALVVIPLVMGFLPLGPTTEFVITLIRWPVVFVIVAAGLAILYRYSPARAPRRWRWITPGAAVACVLWVAGSLAFAYYVSNFGSYNETFGALGGVIILLMWLWLSSVIILLGAEIDSEIEAQAKQNPAPATAEATSASAETLQQHAFEADSSAARPASATDRSVGGDAPASRPEAEKVKGWKRLAILAGLAALAAKRD
ncbi:YihY/virulence factor BrkB family protein [Salipiger sp. IMCC34102]|uniref:YihY/virulence factor BrkB family protein n=1 Tax=Salipiger sp. IMCC34102 TaxID=2510647 RepID=UPI00101CC41B|nr:YihY/virulence factor BrkB family protein [Salipiger sp. IMCC34102]RYH03350.1 YihY/virulence factor BrkB family protein [Salipiger sp. IMCC34102]